MSRSKKKNKFTGITGATSEKENKRTANRTLRRKVKKKIAEDPENIPLLREVSNVWGFDKDGKRYDPDLKDKDLRK